MLASIVKNVFILVIIGGILFAVTRYIPVLKKQTDAQIAKVLGAHTSAKVEEVPLADSLKKDTTEQIEVAKKKALEIKIGDVLSTVQRLQKIPRDIQTLQRSVTETITSFTHNQ